MNLYNKYATRITAEMLDEKSFPVEEMKRYRDEFMALEAEALRCSPAASATSPLGGIGGAAYNQIILYPIQALANLYDMYYSLAYRFKGAGNVQRMKVRVVFSTVMPFVKGGHSVELGFTGCESKTVNLNKDMNWQHCYDLMYPAGAARVIEIENELPVKITAGGVYEFNLKPLAPGLVIQRIIISKNQ